MNNVLDIARKYVDEYEINNGIIGKLGDSGTTIKFAVNFIIKHHLNMSLVEYLTGKIASAQLARWIKGTRKDKECSIIVYTLFKHYIDALAAPDTSEFQQLFPPVDKLTTFLYEEDEMINSAYKLCDSIKAVIWITESCRESSNHDLTPYLDNIHLFTNQSHYAPFTTGKSGKDLDHTECTDSAKNYTIIDTPHRRDTLRHTTFALEMANADCAIRKEIPFIIVHEDDYFLEIASNIQCGGRKVFYLKDGINLTHFLKFYCTWGYTHTPYLIPITDRPGSMAPARLDFIGKIINSHGGCVSLSELGLSLKLPSSEIRTIGYERMVTLPYNLDLLGCDILYLTKQHMLLVKRDKLHEIMPRLYNQWCKFQ